MANKLSTYIILIALLMMIACIPSYAQFACSGTVNMSVIDEKGTKVPMDDAQLAIKNYDIKKDINKSLSDAEKPSICLKCELVNDSNNVTIVCPKGMELCNGACTNISTELNCGGCADKPRRGDHVCKLEQKCCDGECCLPDETCCDGKCTDTYNDLNNCGGCGNISSGEHICQHGETCCGGECADTLFDDNNCGDCGNVCSSGAHCIEGECSSSGGTGEGTEGTDEESEDMQE